MRKKYDTADTAADPDLHCTEYCTVCPRRYTFVGDTPAGTIADHACA